MKSSSSLQIFPQTHFIGSPKQFASFQSFSRILPFNNHSNINKLHDCQIESINDRKHGAIKKINRYQFSNIRENVKMDKLQKQNIKLRKELIQKELNERKYIQKIIQLQNKILNITKQLNTVKSIKNIKIQNPYQQMGKQNMHSLENLSLIYNKNSQKQDLIKFKELFQYVSQKYQLKQIGKVKSYIKLCLRFTDAIRQVILSIFGINQSNKKKQLKKVWKYTKKIFEEWLKQNY